MRRRSIVLMGAGLAVALACGGVGEEAAPPLPASPPPTRATAGVTPDHGAVRDPGDDVAGAFGIVTAAANGAFGVAASEDAVLRLGPDGAVVGTLDLAQPEAVSVGPAGEVAVAQNGAVVVYRADGSRGARVSARALDVALSPDGRWLAIATEDDVRVVDAATGDVRHALTPEYGGGVLAWHPAGHTLFSSDAFHGYAWDADTGKERARFGSGLFEAFDVAPDGAVWTWNGTDAPTRWDPATWAKARPIRNDDLVGEGEVHAGGRHVRLDTKLATVDGASRWGVGSAVDWNTAGLTPDHGGLLIGTQTELQRWRFLPGGVARPLGERRVLDRGFAKGDVVEALVWTTAGLVELRSDGAVVLWDPVAATPKWTSTVACAGQDPVEEEADCVVYGAGVFRGDLWALYGDTAFEIMLPDGRIKAQHDIAGAAVGRLPDGRWVVEDGALRIGDEPGKGAKVTLAGEAWSPRILGDGFVAFVDDALVQRFDARGRPLGAPVRVDGGLTDLLVAPNGALVESSSEATIVRDPVTGHERFRTAGYHAVVDPTGRWIASGLHAVMLTSADGETRRELSLPGPGAFGPYAFSPDGRWLAVGEWDDDIGDLVWIVDLSQVVP